VSAISNATVITTLLLSLQWTLLLTVIAFVGGALGGLAVMLMRNLPVRTVRVIAAAYVELMQGTPLLMQLFIVFFGLPILHVEVSPWLAAVLGLTFYASAYLGEIWRGCVDAVPRGQWDAAASLGLPYLLRLLLVILPQAGRIAVPPTVGFLVQLIKATALTSIIGFTELTRTGEILANATLKPFSIYGLVAMFYFALCYPLTSAARVLERRGQAHDLAPVSLGPSS
jgi:polar amino acid transport system permease protein